ncbi:MAG: hypothetical protein JHC35_00335 [Sulfuricurvum sp.]|jgi:hypothetical protein|uniref:hypothetical protein n=1 Tax=Sulfuricurvum sp. TaxID=2025608 RepID=UPI002600B405|nr:hypothetical protein [Sulfuricurvum sp.]MCI4405713.1 hypothetical protein [Sulfuricurvum sp.]
MDPSWDLFSKYAVSDVARKGNFIPIYPVTAETDKGPIKFHVPGSTDYIDWKGSYIEFDVRISGRKAPGDNDVALGIDARGTHAAPVNNIGHSLFNKVSIEIGGKPITSTYHYPYIAHLNTLLTHDRTSLETFCRLQGWFKDKSTQMDDVNSATVDHLKERKSWFHNRKAQFLIKPYSPLFLLDKFMLPYVDVNVILERREDAKFYMMGEDEAATHPFALHITNPVLYVHKVEAIPEYTMGVEAMLGRNEKSAVYKFTDCQILPLNITTGSTNFTRNNLFQNNIPSRVLIFFVETSAWDGALNKNPFHYKHNKISNIALFKDGVPYPTPELKCDFDNGLYTRAYYQTMRTLAAPDPLAPPITYEEFALGTTIFSYDMSPDQNGSAESSPITNKSSTMRLEVKFREALAMDMMCLIYHEIPMQFTIDNHRNVSVEKFF